MDASTAGKRFGVEEATSLIMPNIPVPFKKKLKKALQKRKKRSYKMKQQRKFMNSRRVQREVFLVLAIMKWLPGPNYFMNHLA